MKKRKLIAAVLCAVVLAVCVAACAGNGQRGDGSTVEMKNGDNVELEYADIAGADFSIQVPKSFQVMEEETIAQKYSGDVPDQVFTNEETTVNIAVSLTENPMQDSQIEEYKDYMEDVMKDVSQVTESDCYQVDGRQVGRLTLVSDGADTKIYNDMMFFSQNGRLVIVAFNCTQELAEDWAAVGDAIVNSLYFK